MRILVVNAGSSSLKLSVIDDRDEIVAATDLPAPKGTADREATVTAIRALGSVDAIGHRIVHGGTIFLAPVRIDGDVVQRLTALTDLAPLHQPKSLAALDAVSRVLPDVPAVACFDTAFHAHMPPRATTYAVPAQWRKRWTLKKYGFHGLSHAYASGRAAQMLERKPEDLRIVVCHLGAGASLAAVAGGHSVDTTMGFTPLAGLVMATRSGSIDPGLILWLEEHAGTPPQELAATLEYRSGLTGLTGTGDMREIEARVQAGDPEATLAFEVYIDRLRTSIGAMVAAMDGLDVLVFTGGVGQNSPVVRAKTVSELTFLGITVDDAANCGSGDRDIGARESKVRTLVIEAREDLQIAREVRGTLETSGEIG